MLGKRLKSDDSERRRGEIAALCALRYGDGRPKYPQAYIAALFGVTPSMVNQIARADGQLRKWTIGLQKHPHPIAGGISDGMCGFLLFLTGDMRHPMPHVPANDGRRT